MTCEILCVGTELLLGDVVNTNAAYIAKNLAGMGVHVYYQSVVGDNPERLKLALETAFAHADCVITTGGLGPTKDDLTKETACAALGVKLELHQPSFEHLAEILKQSGRQMTESQKKQAYLPQGCTVLHNAKGTAPGFAITKDDKTLIMLPGPPREMTAMFESGVRPYLTKGEAQELYSRRVRVMEIGESDCADALSDLLDGKNPTVATYAKDVETEIRITVSADDASTAEAMLVPVVDEVCRRMGDYVYGIDVTSIEQQVSQMLRERGMTIATAESCTGGLIAKSLTDLAGASDVFGFGTVTYANEAKTKLLGVPAETIEQKGAVSPEVAKAMAEGVRRLSGADIGLGITGIAGPDGGTEEKPVGLVYVGVAGEKGTRVEEFRLGSKTRTRNTIRKFAAARALNLVRKYLQQKE